MKNFNILFATCALIILAGCSEPDPNVERLQAFVLEQNKASESEAKCYANGVKDELGDDFPNFVDSMYDKDIGALKYIGTAMKVAADCGIELK